MVGARVRLVAKYSPAALVKAMAEEGITLLNGVPATYQRLLEYKATKGLPQLERGALRLIGVAVSPHDARLQARQKPADRIVVARRIRAHPGDPG